MKDINDNNKNEIKIDENLESVKDIQFEEEEKLIKLLLKKNDY